MRTLNPPEWMMPGRIETRVWLTAYCAHVLIRFGYAEAEGTYCPNDFLLAHCDETGWMAGYLRAVGRLASTYARDLPAILKGVRDPDQAIIIDDAQERAVVGKVLQK